MSAALERAVRQIIANNEASAELLLLVKLPSFENQVCLAVSSGPVTRSVVRLGSVSTHEVRTVNAEIAFLSHLAHSGVAVATPRGSAIQVGDWVGAEFTFVAGEHETLSTLSSEQAYFVGRNLSFVHRSSRSFRYLDSDSRPRWFQDRSFDSRLVDAYLPYRTRAAVASLLDAILSNNREQMLVHGDLSLRNIIFTPSPVFIDFDDCVYADPIYDAAVFVFRTFFEGESGRGLLESFLCGLCDHSDTNLDVLLFENYLRVLCLQLWVTTKRFPGCPGLSVDEAMGLVDRIVTQRGELPGLLGESLEIVSRLSTSSGKGKRS